MPPVAARYRPLPPALLAITFFYLLRMPETLIILRSQQLGVPVAVVPLLWAALHVVRASTSFTGGALSDRLGPARPKWARPAGGPLVARRLPGGPGCGP